MEKIGSREDGLPNVCACVCVGHRRVFFALFFCFEPLVLDKQLMGGRRRHRSTCPLFGRTMGLKTKLRNISME